MTDPSPARRATPLTLTIGVVLVLTALFCLWGALFPQAFLGIIVGAKRAAAIDAPAKMLALFGVLMLPMGIAAIWASLPRR